MGEMGQEPSMEAILSSIRKIIAEDDAKARVTPRAAAGGRAAAEPAPTPSAPPPPAPTAAEAPQAITPNAVPDGAETGAAPAPSEDATAASLQALTNLSRLVAKPEGTGAQTLDGLVREMLTPMLQQWLDAHLPEIVERLVAQEVARLSRQAQG